MADTPDPAEPPVPGSWCLIESDPGVFTELIRGFGCKGAQVEEIWAMDEDAFRHLEPIHGLIFLFKWMQDDEPAGRVISEDCKHIFFAKQVIVNACATQALLGLLMNLQHEDIELGETLTAFKKFCQNFDPYTRGLSISNAEKIRTVHNSFAKPILFELEVKQTMQEEESFHFVCYVPIKGHLYELDGLQDGPIQLAEIESGRNWLDVVRPIIQARMKRYNEGEIRFNLMALVSDRERYYERQIEAWQKPDFAMNAVLSESERSMEIAILRSYVQFEQEKKRRYRRENLRRRHNYLPFIVELVKQLGEMGQLMPIYEKAIERVRQYERTKAEQANSKDKEPEDDE